MICRFSLIALKKPSRTGLRNNTENIHYGFTGIGIADVSNASWNVLVAH